LREIIGILIIVSIVIFSQIARPQLKSDNGKLADGLAVLGIEDKKVDDKSIVTFDEETFYGASYEKSAGELIERLKVVAYPEDLIKTFPDPRFGVGFVMKITRALPVKVMDGNQEKLLRTFSQDVKAFLVEKNIELGDKDKITPNIDGKLVKDMAIIIVRVEETEVKIKKIIEFKTEYKDDPNLEKGKERVSRQGSAGEKELTYLVRRENGQEVARDLKNVKALKEPESKIILRGTKEVVYGIGVATWFDAPTMTAAHNFLPPGTVVEVTNVSNGKKVTVNVIGGGIMGRAIIDLSPDAFAVLAPLGAGVINVKIAKP